MEELALHLLHEYVLFMFYVLVGKILCRQVLLFHSFGGSSLAPAQLHILCKLYLQDKEVDLNKAGIVL
jgi:hypothetical protein